MVLEAGMPVDSAEIVEEDMDSDEEQEEEESDDDNDINNEREEEEGEEEMEGSDVETQKDNITVLLKTEKAVTQSLTKTETGLKADEVNEFNLQSNKERKKFFKKQQKERRKQAVSSIEAMVDSDDAYNFDTDFS
ncbi:guanine nucleotide-binding protein-like 3 homolog [Montipora foliosa]